MKCRECGNPTNNKDKELKPTDICFNCDIIIQQLKVFADAISNYQPIRGHKRKLEILNYKITLQK